MKIYAFYLSGEHDSLPRSEALSLLSIYSSSFKEIFFLDQCLIVQAHDLDMAELEVRLALTHSIIQVLIVCNALLPSLKAAAQNICIQDKRYCVRAYRIKQAILPADQVERAIGSVLKEKGFKADLENPEMYLKAIITEKELVVGIEVGRPSRSAFEARRPHVKPFFHPGVLMPRIARALVNISQVCPGESLLDPFSGTAGILVEACLLGVKGIGVDVQKRLIKGAKANLQGLDCSLILGDAKRLPFSCSSLDSAVLDVPYGKSAIIEADTKEALINDCLSELFRVIKLRRRMVIVADRDIRSNISEAGFKLLEYHQSRVHRSLTRHIFVCSK
jgi:tRNA (guanine10-N2)-dimethyltransferase